MIKRDRLLNNLRKLIDAQHGQADAAVRRVMAKVEARRNKLSGEKKKRARDTRTLATVARELFLDPGEMEAPAFVVSEAGEEREGYFNVMLRPGTKIPRWMERARELGVYIDITTVRQIANLRGFMQLAQDHGYDVRAGTGPDAYIHARTLKHERGQLTREEVLPEIDESVAVFAVPEPWLVFNQFEIEVARDLEDVRTDGEWWDVGVLFLWVHVPSFDWAELGDRRAFPWKAPIGHRDYGSARFQYRETLSSEDKMFAQREDLLLDRAVEYISTLSQLAKYSQSDLNPDVDGGVGIAEATEMVSDAPEVVDSESSKLNVITLRLSLSAILQSDSSKTYESEDVAKMYGITPDQFTKYRDRYVQRGDRKAHPHLLPVKDQPREDGKYRAVSWTRDEVANALDNWIKKLEPGSPSGIG